jgi:hypothetical protein
MSVAADKVKSGRSENDKTKLRVRGVRNSV